MNSPPPSRDLARITLAVLVIGLMIVACLWILQPFLGATIWAIMIVVATWPMMLGVQARLGGRRWAAVTVMTVVMLLVLVVPIVVAVATIVEHADDMVAWAKALAAAGIPSPPGWLQQVPFIGERMAKEWQQLAATPPADLVARATPYARQAVQWFAARAGGFGLMMLQFLLIVIITAILYSMGETAALGVRRFARRLADDRGESSVVLAGQAIRGVALGVVVTALAQSTLAGIGLAVAGIPYAAVLTAIAFILCIAQLGPLLVLAPAVGWLYWTGDPVWGTVLLVWTVIVSSMDNFLRPFLIKRGADLPLLLIFVGVIGGLIGFGVIGLFVGPTILAVTYRLLESWVADIDGPRVENVEQRNA
ncbi:MAG TPA: AI-2E family transporter YdiK [Burkholderiales bacterium]|nr:AI-2E family transporter YdiK [Burkholderiales bacterium]